MGGEWLANGPPPGLAGSVAPEAVVTLPLTLH
jgi:hypothetical protein